MAVYCGSSTGGDAVFVRGAAELATVLLRKGIGVVYGGGGEGMMGVVADVMIQGGGEVIGVIPQSQAYRETAHAGVRDMRVVGSMHERKLLMANLADGFIALPGGTGTLEEIMEAFTWTKLGIHKKPCGLLNVAGFYDLLDDLLNSFVANGFLKEEHRKLLVIERDPEILLDTLLRRRENLRNYKF